MPKIHFGAQEYINVLSAKGSGYWAAVQALSLTRRAWRRKKQVRHSSFDQDTSLTVYAVDGRGASWLQWRPVEPGRKIVHSVFNKGAMHNLCSDYFSLSIHYSGLPRIRLVSAGTDVVTSDLSYRPRQDCLVSSWIPASNLTPQEPCTRTKAIMVQHLNTQSIFQASLWMRAGLTRWSSLTHRQWGRPATLDWYKALYHF